MNDFNGLMGNYAKIAEMGKMLSGKNTDVQSIMKAMGYSMPTDTDLLSKVGNGDPMQLASLLNGLRTAPSLAKSANSNKPSSFNQNGSQGDFNAYIFRLAKGENKDGK